MRKFLLTLSVFTLPLIITQAFGSDQLDNKDSQQNLTLHHSSASPSGNLSASQSLTVSFLGSDESADNLPQKITALSLNYHFPSVSDDQRKEFEKAVLPGKLLPTSFFFNESEFSTHNYNITFFVRAHTTDPFFKEQKLVEMVNYADINLRKLSYHCIRTQDLLAEAFSKFKNTQMQAFSNGYTDFGVTVESLEIATQKTNIKFSFEGYEAGAFPCMFTLGKVEGKNTITASRI